MTLLPNFKKNDTSYPSSSNRFRRSSYYYLYILQKNDTSYPSSSNRFRRSSYYYLYILQRANFWAFFSLFLLVFPTGNAMSERGFSAMGATHSKQRSELSHEQVLASMVIGFNGPLVLDFSSSIDRESREKFGPEWWGYVHPSTSSM
jgi:hypothetical protein